MTDSRSSSGFTLVELIITLSLTVLLAGATGALLRTILAARQTVEHRLDGAQEATVAMQAIVSALRNGYRTTNAKDVLFEGTQEDDSALPASRLRFRGVSLRPVRTGEPESDVRDFEFFMRHEGEPALMRRTDPTRNTAPDAGGVLEPLAMNVVGLDCRYFDGQQWLTYWPENQQQWPSAVSVRLLFIGDPRTGRMDEMQRLVSFPNWSKPTAQTEIKP